MGDDAVAVEILSDQAADFPNPDGWGVNYQVGRRFCAPEAPLSRWD